MNDSITPQVRSRDEFWSGTGLAGLAGVLAARLSAAARLAHGPGDRAACQDAAAQAGQVYELLAPAE